MSDFTDSLRKKGDEFLSFLLDFFEHADNMHSLSIIENDKMNEMYWQGRKDAIRAILAARLNKPEIADLSEDSPTNFERMSNAR